MPNNSAASARKRRSSSCWGFSSACWFSSIHRTARGEKGVRNRCVVANCVETVLTPFPVHGNVRRGHSSNYGVDAEDVVVAGRRKVENDLARLAERHSGAGVDVGRRRGPGGQ